MEKGGSKQHKVDRDDLSDVASTHMDDQQSLHDEELPSYDQLALSGPASTRAPTASEEKSALARQQFEYVAATERSSSSHTGPSAQPPAVPDVTGHAVGPTAAAPFNFPISELPAYEDAVDISKPLAVPQISPKSDAPFVTAFSRQFLSYGIPAETWYNFVDTLSAFVAADISQQAVQHAVDFAQRIAEYHKEYAYQVTKKAVNIGKRAQRFELGGVIGGVLGLATHSVGHVVGTVFHTHNNIWTKPRTPRERATAYIATANADWFNPRGLHAILLDTQELARVLGLSFQQLIASVNSPALMDPAKQLGALSNYIAQVELREEEEPAVQHFYGASGPNMQRAPTSASFSSAARRGSADLLSGNAAGKRPVTGQIQVGADSLWLVLTQESKIQAMQNDMNRISNAKRGRR